MIVWLIVHFLQVETFPLLSNDTVMGLETTNETSSAYANMDLLEALLAIRKTQSDKKREPRFFEPYSLFNITLKVNDWRDMHKRHQIIWSLESPNHPEFGKNYPKGFTDNLRMTKSSQMMSFMILGSVIGFILYTYLAHVLMMRRIDKEMKAAELKELVRRSALIMAGSAQQNDLEVDTGRRHSLINMFKGFKL